jgi:hypothetical protein
VDERTQVAIEFGDAKPGPLDDVFVDSAGYHAFASTETGDNFYLHSQSTKARPMTKLRGWISDVVWDEESTAASTQGILVAMHAGKIYHVVVEAGKERSARVMHQLDERLLALKAVGPTVFAARRAGSTPSRGRPTISRARAFSTRYLWRKHR